MKIETTTASWEEKEKEEKLDKEMESSPCRHKGRPSFVAFEDQRGKRFVATRSLIPFQTLKLFYPDAASRPELRSARICITISVGSAVCLRVTQTSSKLQTEREVAGSIFGYLFTLLVSLGLMGRGLIQ